MNKNPKNALSIATAYDSTNHKMSDKNSRFQTNASGHFANEPCKGWNPRNHWAKKKQARRPALVRNLLSSYFQLSTVADFSFTYASYERLKWFSGLRTLSRLSAWSQFSYQQHKPQYKPNPSAPSLKINSDKVVVFIDRIFPGMNPVLINSEVSKQINRQIQSRRHLKMPVPKMLFEQDGRDLAFKKKYPQTFVGTQSKISIVRRACRPLRFFYFL